MSVDALHTVSLSGRMIQRIYTQFGDTQETRASLLDGVSIAPSGLSAKRTHISAYDEIRFLSNISNLKGEDWVWRHADLWKPKELDDLGLAVMNAPNCGAALDVLTQFGHLWGPNLFFEQFRSLEDAGRRRVLTLGLVFEDGDSLKGTEFLREIVMLRVYYMLDHVLGRVWGGSEIRFRGEINVPVDVYKNLLRCSVVKAQSRSGFSLPSALCEKPSWAGNPAAFRKAMVNLYKGTGSPTSDDAFKVRVTNYLTAISNGRPRSEEVAAHLGVSLRTMNRKLKDNGTSFRKLLDMSLKRRAYAQLAAKTLSRAQISERLGFNDQASFSRALKRWRQNH